MDVRHCYWCSGLNRVGFRKLQGWSVSLLVLCSLFLSGCTSSPHSSAADDRQHGSTPTEALAGQVRLIIKFKPAVADPSAAEFLEQLSAETGVSLEYVRPVFGGAHVYITSQSVPPPEKQVVLNKLSERDDVEYVEEDALMLPMRVQ